MGNDAYATSKYTATVAESAGTLSVPVTVDFLPNEDTTFTIEVLTTGTATQGSDFTIADATLDFGQMTAKTLNLEITLTDDDDIEDDETIQLRIADAPSGDTGLNDNYVRLESGVLATITVTSEDVRSTNANLSGLTAATSTSATGTFNSLTLSPAFDAATTAYTANVENDITHAKLTPTVADTGATVQVGPQGGTLTTVNSGSASAALALSEGANAFTVRVTAEDTNVTKDYTVTITRASSLPTVSLSASPNPVNEGSSVTITATLSAAQKGDVTIPVTITDNTAGSGDHGTLASITISGGGTTGTGTITTTQDTDDESDETFTVTLGTTLPTGIAAGTPSSVQITIRDDDTTTTTATVSLSASPREVAEGSSVTITATLSAAQTSAVTIPITITDNTAESTDHGTLTSIAINANAASGTGTITTNQDADAAHETFTVALGTPLPSGITAGSPSSVQITIRDDEATVPAAITGLSVGPGYGSLVLSWTAPAGDVTGYEVHYTTSMTVGADEDAVPEHHGLYPETEWVIDPRHTGALGTRPTQTINDLEPEPHRVRVRALNDSGPGAWVTGRGTPMPRKIAVHLTATPNPLVEGGDVTVTATLKIGDLPTHLQYDFFVPLWVTRIDSEEGDHGTVSGVTIQKLQRSASVVIPTHRDGDGDDEFFTVSVGRLTEPVRADDTEGSVRVRIAEREPPRVSLAASPNPVHEGNTVTVTAQLSQAMSSDLTLPVTVTGIDSEHGDHGSLGSITVPRGQTVGTGTITTRVDDDRDDERFTVALGSVPLPAAAGSPASVEVTITDQTEEPEPDPGPPTDTHGLLSVSPSPAREGDTVTLTATLENPAPSGGTLVRFLTYGEGSSPASAADYTLSPSTGQGGNVFQDRTPEIRIPSGQRTATATLSITDDGTGEGDETLGVKLAVSFSDRQVGYNLTLTIQDTTQQQNSPCDNCGTGGDTGAVAQGPAQYADLIVKMKEWRNDPEWAHLKEHTDRWDRALLAFGETVEDTTLTPMTAAEAQGFADRGWERWVDVAAALRVLENQAPTVSSAIADVTIVSDSGSHEVSLAGVFDDADGDGLTISAASSDEATATASVSSGGSTLTVTARLRGTSTITVTANDGNGGTVDDSFTVTVKAAPLVVSAIGDVSGLAAGDTRDVSLSGVFSDADGDALTVTASSGDDTIATVSVSSDGSTLTLSGVAEGTATVTVTAQDADGNRVSDSFQVEVSAGGRYADLIARMYQWRNDPQWVSEKAHTDRWDRALLAFGETVADATLTPMTAAEAQALADQSWGTRWVPVAAALWELQNRAPTVAAAIADVTIVNEVGSQQVSLSGVFSDADNDALTISAASSDEAKATVSVATDYSSLTVSAQARGTATITVTAADGNGGTVDDAFTVTVKAAPDVASAIADVSGLEAGATRDVSLSGAFSDADGDALTVTASSDDEAVATVSVAADHSALTVAGVAEGTATVTVIAQDSDGNLVMDDFDVSVVAQQQQQQVTPNQAPTVSSAIGDATIVSESGTKQVSLSGVFSDADNDSLTVTAASSDETKATVSVAADYSSLTVSAKARGTATITVTANDGRGGTAEDSFTVTVKAAPVVASAIADMDLKAGATEAEGGAKDVALSGVFSDADGDALTFTADTSDSTIAEAFLFQGILTVLALADGSVTVTVTARDSDGNTVSDTINVSVVGPPTPVSNLSCVAQTGRVLFSWDAPKWSGAAVYATTTT